MCDTSSIPVASQDQPEAPLCDWRELLPRVVWNRCNRRRWPPGGDLSFNSEQRRKPRHVLLYFWAGQGWRRTPEGEVPVAAGDCHWSRPGWTYACRQSNRNSLGVTAIHFDLADASGRLVQATRTRLPREILTVRQPELVNAITGRVADLAMQVRSGVGVEDEVRHAADVLFHGLLLTLAGDTAAARGGPAAGRERMWPEVTQYVQDHLAEPPSVAALARRWGYSRFHFTHLFTAHFGLSPQTYIMNSRLALAKELLRETDLGITQVAARTGFRDLARFSNGFRERVGVAPSVYRHCQENTGF